MTKTTALWTQSDPDDEAPAPAATPDVEYPCTCTGGVDEPCRGCRANAAEAGVPSSGLAISAATRKKIDDTILAWSEPCDLILQGVLRSLGKALTKEGVNIPGVGALLVLSFGPTGDMKIDLAPVYPRRDTPITE